MLQCQTTVSPLSFVHLPQFVDESAQLAELLVHQADAHSPGRSSVYSPVGAVEGSWSGLLKLEVKSIQLGQAF